MRSGCSSDADRRSETKEMANVYWVRRDARLDDNPALVAATSEGPVCVLFVIDPEIFDRSHARRKDLLVAGLRDLDRRLSRDGGRLRIEYGDPVDVVAQVAQEVGADRVHVNAEVTPYGVRRDVRVAERCTLVEHDGVYVRPPGTVLTSSGQPYRVFTPFFKAWSEVIPAPVETTGSSMILDHPGEGLPDVDEPPMTAGETAAVGRLEQFLDRVDNYLVERDRIDLDTTSQLSGDLKYGWIGARRVVSAVGRSTEARRGFVRQIAWRDFYGHLIDANPGLGDTELDQRFREIRWRNDPEDIHAWKSGQTGYPLVDAAMRRLVSEGAMHNRARMAVASFLVKDLLVDWRVGERFFRHHLNDGDVAQNAGNWQWVAGTGTDAAPYFRVFNPVTQSRRFDPEGRFISRWLPELADLPGDVIHAPWEHPPLELAAHGVVLGRDYPEPIVDHSFARVRAIEAYEAARGTR